MHLNDALGHQEGLRCLYQHHEQACAIAAEAYARIHNKIGALCVTTGPGGTNAITGVVGGWLDSIPMLILSGQVRYDTTARWSGVGIRAMGDQEFDIVKSIDCMTKYSEMVIDPLRIRYCLEKALYLATSGRPGPTWLDIPLDVQGAYVDTEQLAGFDAADYEAGGTGWALHTVGMDHTSGAAVFAGATEEKEKKAVLAGVHGTEGTSEVEPPHAIVEDYAGKGEHRQVLPAPVSRETARAIIEKIRKAKRPVLYAGNGIRIAGAFDAFMEVADGLGIPAVVGWNANDCSGQCGAGKLYGNAHIGHSHAASLFPENLQKRQGLNSLLHHVKRNQACGQEIFLHNACFFLFFFLGGCRKGIGCCQRRKSLRVLVCQIQKIFLQCLKLSKQFLHCFFYICVFFLSNR